MKTIMKISVAVIISIISSYSAIAQMSQYKFEQVFNQAFAAILNGNYAEATPLLTQLNESDRTHGQVQYLLAMSRIKEGNFGGKTVRLLEEASKKYNFYHAYGDVKDETSPANVWFLLAESYAHTGAAKKSIDAYRNYMSCIPLASIQHKRSIIEKISAQQVQLARSSEVGSSSMIASRKP